MEKIITSFAPPYFEFSIFFPSLIKVGTIPYPTLYQALISLKTFDKDTKIQIAQKLLPADIKELDEKIKEPAWWNSSEKIALMRELNWQKFSQNEYLRKKLIDTGNANLINELLYEETFFGVYKGIGENHLGKILQELRGKLKS